MTEPLSPSRHRRELFFNQLWQGLNFASKAGVLAILTPFMYAVWGKEGFGMFSLASILLVSMAVLDGGVRSMTRIKLSEALVDGDERAFGLHLGRGLASFGCVAAVATAAASALALGGVWERLFRLPPGGDLIIAATVGLVGLLMLSFIALEPLAARGRLSALKAANTAGACAALPVLALLLWLHAPVVAAVFANLACLIAPNLFLILRHGLLGRETRRHWGSIGWRDVLGTFHAGGWYYSTTVAWIVKSYGLGFVISAVGGVGMVGSFYVLLRITDIVGNLGSTSSDTALASLTHARSAAERAEKFRNTYLYAAVFGIYGSLAIGFLGALVLRLWLPNEDFPAWIGWAMAAYGSATALSRIAVNASMGTGRIRTAGLGTIGEALLVIGTAFLVIPAWGVPGVLAAGSLASVCLLPAARGLCRDFGQTFAKTWVFPVFRLLPLLAVGGAALALAALPGSLTIACAGAAAAATCALVELRRLHR